MDDVLAPARVKHRMVGSEQEMRQAIDDELAGAGGAPLAVMGGHFLLVEDADSGRLVPGIAGEQASEAMRRRVSGRVGIFPEYTWRLSVDLVREYGPRFADARLLLLVNDWQYVPAGEKSAAELRAEFYAGFDHLPPSYQEVLRAAGYSTDRMLPSRKHPLAFPETWLKYRFQKAADKLVRQGVLEKRVLDDGDRGGTDSEVGFLDENGNYRALMSCGVTGCAGEVTEMIAEVHRVGYRTMIIFAPGECLSPVQTGVATALNVYGLTGMRIVIADPGGSGEATTEEIFDKLVTVSSYRN